VQFADPRTHAREYGCACLNRQGGTMNNTLFAIRNPGRMICAWIPTGDSKAPLVCVWFETSDPRTASTMSSDKEPAEMRLCA
jgi:hypothetical protein